jgi:hypothetical protein
MLFTSAGSWLAQVMRSSRFARTAALTTVLIAGIGQLLWSMAIAQGVDGPAVTYFLSWDDGGPVVRHDGVRILSLVDTNDESRLNAMPSSSAAETPRRSRALAYLARLVFVFGIALAVCVWSTSRRRRRYCIALWLAASVLLTEAGLSAACAMPTYWDLSQALQLAPGEALAVRIEVPAVRSEALLSRRAESQELSLFVPAHGPCEIEWRIDGRQIPLAPLLRHEAACRWSDLPAEARRLDPEHREHWEITLRNPGPQVLAVSGWQRSDTPGKTLADSSSSCLPAIEFRVREQSTGALRRLAF